MKKTRFSWYLYQFSYYIQNRFSSNKKPLLGGIKLTHNCNLKCKHCPFWKKERRNIPFLTAKKSFMKLYKLGVRILIIEGGEPLLWKENAHDIHNIIDEANKLFYCTGITTNGTLPIDVNTKIVWVSIDGLKDTHDYIRGKSFDKIISNIKKSSHPNIYANITINSLNWKEVGELVKFLSEIVKGITIQFFYPYMDIEDELILTHRQRNTVLNNLIDLKKKGYPVSVSFACLSALKDNKWKCRPWMISSVDPDGTLTVGCYVKNRGEIACEKCGFAAHTEISLAFNCNIESIITGNKIFR